MAFHRVCQIWYIVTWGFLTFSIITLNMFFHYHPSILANKGNLFYQLLWILCYCDLAWDGCQPNKMAIMIDCQAITIPWFWYYALDNVESAIQLYLFILHEFHETGLSVTCYFLKKDSQMMLRHHNARVNLHRRWKQTRNRVCFHLWCELTLALWCLSIIWSLFSWNKM